MRENSMKSQVADLAAFLAEGEGTRPALARMSMPPESILTLGDIDELLAGGLLRAPYVEMVKSEQRISLADYTVTRNVYEKQIGGYADTAKVHAALRDRATLLFRCAHHWHAEIADLTNRLADELYRKTEAFVFLTPAGAQGLPAHRDDADVLCLQLAGRKRWTIYGGAPGGDWKLGWIDEPGPVLLDVTAEPGDILYIPRSFGHEAVGDGGFSLHLSLTIREIGLSELRREAEKALFDRLDVPALPLGDAGVTAAADQLIQVMRERLAALTAEQLVGTARREMMSDPHPPQRPGSLLGLVEPA
ncbi:Cupin superfamily protein [Amycolatopsis xylanica]|uniref:Cupin superfamily protein n=1 Tax=Amycolatopsis xylanica TaxID=589385 RepID=A0A1H3PKZ5_9PSEU|nr:cupin domain-containing protein [Amycolatopsis xylanica]SDZ01653.1 Cupin superfamily protein [Amycolatopsis xylanica]